MTIWSKMILKCCIKSHNRLINNTIHHTRQETPAHDYLIWAFNFRQDSIFYIILLANSIFILFLRWYKHIFKLFYNSLLMTEIELSFQNFKFYLYLYKI